MKKIFILVLSFIICFSTLCYANKDYIEEATNVLTKMKIIIGNENGDLMLKNSLTRAEFATIITRLLDLEKTDTPTTKLQFEDVPDSFWGYSAIYKCVEKGYLIGNGDGTFKPNSPIKYEEVLTIMLRILDQDTDLELWPEDYIIKSIDINITKNTSYNQGDIIDRGNSFIIIYNCLSFK